jgi:hypothetical protein
MSEYQTSDKDGLGQYELKQHEFGLKRSDSIKIYWNECYNIHFKIHTVWSKEELIHQWKGFVILPVYILGDKIHWPGMYLLSAWDNILFNILLSRLSEHRESYC